MCAPTGTALRVSQPASDGDRMVEFGSTTGVQRCGWQYKMILPHGQGGQAVWRRCASSIVLCYTTCGAPDRGRITTNEYVCLPNCAYPCADRARLAITCRASELCALVGCPDARYCTGRSCTPRPDHICPESSARQAMECDYCCSGRGRD